ncbi:LPS-assembly lipoprotein [Pasteurella langaaensis DSM 22999]|uniref:LPS-assembly lipoprotein LptE n=1 Tax=Alitibacter langaaensis DSM 22999 TaxID=1122935 RepID=A0A2U0T5J5_9PAST|nr:LPS assembly lipoprotein LptE [Pasteurella langaaensis]PVX38869.1 LPS-assembly lipoprotein [Pasteurella langaaensis DSM 22999]
MFKTLKKIALLTSIAALSACGFHFQHGQLIPQELKTLTFESNDPYSDMSMAMRKQLQINNIKLVDANESIPVLRIDRIRTSDEVVSVFKQGREAEKMLMMQVDASVHLPKQNTYPISVKVNRTFFDNSRAALAKSAEKEVIWNDMREQAARQIISKMVALQHQVKTAK